MAETLVAGIVGTHFVAVGNEAMPAVEIQRPDFGQQGHACGGGIMRAKQEVAVAADEVNGCMGGKIAQGFGNLYGGMVGHVVPQPDFEQVAEDIQGIHFAPPAFQGL